MKSHAPWEKPKDCIARNKNLHSNLSYALAISSLNTIFPPVHCRCKWLMSSWANTTCVEILRPLTKPACSSSIKRGSSLENLVASIFEIILPEKWPGSIIANLSSILLFWQQDESGHISFFRDMSTSKERRNKVPQVLLNDIPATSIKVSREAIRTGGTVWIKALNSIPNFFVGRNSTKTFIEFLTNGRTDVRE